ncbi:hypothetical protein AAY473_026650, partial [Plecturocebus cupreus]
MGFHCVGQAGLELLTSSDSPALAPQSAGITGVSHGTCPGFYLYSDMQSCEKETKLQYSAIQNSPMLLIPIRTKSEFLTTAASGAVL